ncbi:hypothetical protein DX885_003102 [Vibrio mimicus]
MLDIFNNEIQYRCPFWKDPDTCSCASCFNQRLVSTSRSALKTAEAKNISPSGSAVPNIKSLLAPVPPKKTVKERLEAQRKANLEASDKAFADMQMKTLQISPNNLYWPPYNSLATEGQKYIQIEYIEPVTSIAVLSLEEAKEFYENMSVKEKITNSKDYKDLANGGWNAYSTAKGLGSLGVQSRVKNINGVDWIIIKNFRRHKQTLMKGNKWLASNPMVVQAAMGLTSVKGAKTYIKANPGFEVAFSIGINAADYILSDEATLIEFGVNSAKDMAKGFAATVIAGSLAVALSGGSILAAGAIFAIASWGMGQILDTVDDNFGFSKGVTKELERLAQ